MNNEYEMSPGKVTRISKIKKDKGVIEIVKKIINQNQSIIDQNSFILKGVTCPTFTIKKKI